MRPAFQEHARDRPSFAEARVALINLQVTNGEFKSAVAEARSSSGGAGSGDAWFLLGKTYLRLQDYKKAVAPSKASPRPGSRGHIFSALLQQIGKPKEAPTPTARLALKDDPSWRADLASS